MEVRRKEMKCEYIGSCVCVVCVCCMCVRACVRVAHLCIQCETRRCCCCPALHEGEGRKKVYSKKEKNTEK